MVDETVKSVLINSFHGALNEISVSGSSRNQFEIHTSETGDILTVHDFIMLTVSSLNFRFIFNLHYKLDYPVKSFLISELSELDESSEIDTFENYLAEYVNLLGGLLKRRLNAPFPFLGLSTPDKMDSKCFKHLDQSEYDLKLFGKAIALTDGSELFQYSLFFFADRDIGPVESTIEEVQEETEIVEGELELF